MKRMLIFLGLFLVASPALAQDGLIALYDEGMLAFDYEQWPFGNYDGSFSAEGAALDTLIWGDTQLVAAGGRFEVRQDTTMVWAYGAIYNSDDSIDVAVVVVRGLGGISPGVHPIDVSNYMSQFGFFDGVSEFTIPTDSTDVQDWLETVVAEHKFFGASGSILVTAVNDSSFAGQFSGQMVDIEDFTIIDIDGGVFDMSGGPVVTTAPEAPARIAHGSWPNPFNPKTRLFFTLPTAGHARVTVHDVAGRRLALLWDGLAPAGRTELDWSARDDAGHALPAGLYLYRVESPFGRAAGKLMLLP